MKPMTTKELTTAVRQLNERVIFLEAKCDALAPPSDEAVEAQRRAVDTASGINAAADALEELEEGEAGGESSPDEKGDD